MWISLLKALFVGAYGGWVEGSRKAKNETEMQKLHRLVRALPTEDACIIVALAQMDDPEPVIDAMDPAEVERLYILTECLRMDLREDFPT